MSMLRYAVFSHVRTTNVFPQKAFAGTDDKCLSMSGNDHCEQLAQLANGCNLLKCQCVARGPDLPERVRL